MRDWVEDESLSRQETLARFEALRPEPSMGPPSASQERGVHVQHGFRMVITKNSSGTHLVDLDKGGRDVQISR